MDELLKIIQQPVGFGYESSMPYMTILLFQFPIHSCNLKFRFSFFRLSHPRGSVIAVAHGNSCIYLGQLIVTRFSYIDLYQLGVNEYVSETEKYTKVYTPH